MSLRILLTERPQCCRQKMEAKHSVQLESGYQCPKSIIQKEWQTVTHRNAGQRRGFSFRPLSDSAAAQMRETLWVSISFNCHWLSVMLFLPLHLLPLGLREMSDTPARLLIMWTRLCWVTDKKSPIWIWLFYQVPLQTLPLLWSISVSTETATYMFKYCTFILHPQVRIKLSLFVTLRLGSQYPAGKHLPDSNHCKLNKTCDLEEGYIMLWSVVHADGIFLS